MSSGIITLGHHLLFSYKTEYDHYARFKTYGFEKIPSGVSLRSLTYCVALYFLSLRRTTFTPHSKKLVRLISEDFSFATSLNNFDIPWSCFACTTVVGSFDLVREDRGISCSRMAGRFWPVPILRWGKVCRM